MKVFISWSGELSKKIARAMTEWLPSALQNVKPWFSEEIEKGANWQNELSSQLKDTKFSIIILTGEALKSDWIMFEAGATANAVGRTHACPLLFGIEPADVRGPLASLQLTRFVRDDFFRLFKTINAAMGDSKLEEPVLSSVFEKWWPDLEKRVQDILASAPSPKRPKRDTNEMVEETLLLVRSIQNSLEGNTTRDERRAWQQMRSSLAHQNNIKPLILASLLRDDEKRDDLTRNYLAALFNVSSETLKNWTEGKPESKGDDPSTKTKE
jgi:hypothetical protein